MAGRLVISLTISAMLCLGIALITWSFAHGVELRGMQASTSATVIPSSHLVNSEYTERNIYYAPRSRWYNCPNLSYRFNSSCAKVPPQCDHCGPWYTAYVIDQQEKALEALQAESHELLREASADD